MLLPDKSNKTRIIMSFAMVDHGALFAMWLRDALMKRFGFFAPNAVYLDCIATRQLSTHHSMTTPESRVSGDTYVFPDRRPESLAQGYTPIGAMNENWEGIYDTAMSEASAMIMVVTPSYLASNWCMQEWDKFKLERKRRQSFHGVCLTFHGDNIGRPGSASGMPNDREGIKSVVCSKVKGGPGHGPAWHPDSFHITDSDLNAVVAALGRL